MQGQAAPNQPQAVDATMMLSATLQAQEWNVILNTLNEAPYRVAAPLIQKLGQQLQEQTGALGPQQAVPNGQAMVA